MERMKVVDLKVLAKEHGLRGYSELKKAELITLLQNNLPTSRPPLPPSQSVRLRPDRPRQNAMLGSQEMDIFEQQEICKNRPQVTSKLNNWYYCLTKISMLAKRSISHVFSLFIIPSPFFYTLPIQRPY